MATTPNLNLPLIESNMTADVPRDMNALANAVDAAAAKKSDVGDMSTVPTTAKSAAGAIAELFTSVSNGKSQVAAAITDKGVPTSSTDAFATMAANIEAIPVGPDTSDATATAADILAPKTAYGAAGTKLTGTMTNRGAVTLTPGAADVAIPAGYHNGSGKVSAVANLNAGNIKTGVTVGGVAGTFTNDATAGAADILSGKTGYVNGSKITGSMVNRGAPTWTPGTTNQTLSSGYYSGGTVLGDADLIEENIRSGVNIFGVVGTLIEGKPRAQGTTQSAISTGIITVSGLAFSPRTILLVIGSFPSWYYVWSADQSMGGYKWAYNAYPVSIGSPTINTDGFILNSDIGNSYVRYICYG